MSDEKKVKVEEVPKEAKRRDLESALDLQRLEARSWLVKVPAFVAAQWDGADRDAVLGTLKMASGAVQKARPPFRLPLALAPPSLHATLAKRSRFPQLSENIEIWLIFIPKVCLRVRNELRLRRFHLLSQPFPLVFSSLPRRTRLERGRGPRRRRKRGKRRKRRKRRTWRKWRK